MTATEWGTLAEVVSAVGIIITLIYLAIQIHQNTRQMKSQGMQLALRQFLAAFENSTATVGDADIMRRGLHSFDNLPPSDQGVFHSKMHAMLTGFAAVWYLYNDGLIPKYELQAMRGLFLLMLSSPGGSEWWNAFKHVPPPVLIEYIDGHLNQNAHDAQSAANQFPWLR